MKQLTWDGVRAWDTSMFLNFPLASYIQKSDVRDVRGQFVIIDG